MNKITVLYTPKPAFGKTSILINEYRTACLSGKRVFWFQARDQKRHLLSGFPDYIDINRDDIKISLDQFRGYRLDGIFIDDFDYLIKKQSNDMEYILDFLFVSSNRILTTVSEQGMLHMIDQYAFKNNIELLLYTTVQLEQYKIKHNICQK